MLPFSNYKSQSLSLDPGTRLFVYTDGMTEVFRGNEEFGEQRLLDTFLTCKEPTPQETLDFVWKTLQNFSGGREQSDDMTSLVLFRNT
jgi:serine phosphatase RsbU (regulator of sigma subunit)